MFRSRYFLLLILFLVPVVFNVDGQDIEQHSLVDPDGARIVSGSADKTIKVWDASSGEELRTLKGHTESVFSASFSPDGE